jgi:hypothetical protein
LVSTGTAMVFKKSSPTWSAMKNGGGRVAVIGRSGSASSGKVNKT